MVHVKIIIVTTILSFILLGCVNNKDGAIDNTPIHLYSLAKKELINGNYKRAIKELEKVNQCHPFSIYAQKAQIDLIYAYYKSDDSSLVTTFSDRFLRLNPTHPNIDYILYIRGLTSMEMDGNPVFGYFGLDQSCCNPEHAKIAFQDFKKLILHYPHSQYALDATKRLIYLKHRLAKHELCIVKYYTARGAYVAVINRVEKMLQDFPDTQATLNALPYMEKAYRALQLNNLANKVEKIIEINRRV
ncbi:outer membrane protein assembly factor BamD [Candidatus Curculioniphilus buchneri]|uniref:outer membrane protein assembly factor BamD n=1 Tax=Candidatus Curculioniphilus buchneri TaxID=690594 RepID=UPI00376EA8E9